MKRLDFNTRLDLKEQQEKQKRSSKYSCFCGTNPIYIDVSSKKNKSKKAKRR